MKDVLIFLKEFCPLMDLRKILVPLLALQKKLIALFFLKCSLFLTPSLYVGKLLVFPSRCLAPIPRDKGRIIPDPVRRVRTTRSSTHAHPFQVTLSNPRTLAHKLSFIPRTSQLWNSLPPITFPESYNLSSFKSNINKLYFVSLST